MTHYSNIPLVRIVIPVITGIVVFKHTQFFLSLSQAAGLIILFFSLAIIIEKYFQKNFNYRFAFGLNLMLFFLIAGYLLAQDRYEKNEPVHFSNQTLDNSYLRIQLTEPVSEKTNTYQIIGRATHILADDTLKEARGRLIAYFEKDSLAATLSYGDIVFLENNTQEVQPPQNPNAFNFKNFLANQNIFHQTYRRSGQWYKTGENEGHPVVSLAHSMRTKALETLEANNIKGREFAVASALLLGYRDYLDEDLQREFAGAGAMHILCVSGLHVGIIFLVLNILLNFMKSLPYGRVLKTLLIILLIWFYAAITGFSPSVLRASTMFSFLAIGQSFSRSTNIYNTLAASALLLILLDPFIIYRIGFQLSYIAVISIVWLQPLFYRQLYFKNRLLDYSWGIITVSLAAQLGTGPLALYYFNQFPNYFLLTNLAVIPLTGLIIKAGILFFMVSPVPFLSFIIGKVLSSLIFIMHNAVKLIEGMPGSVAYNVFISFHEALFIFGIILLAGLYWIHARKRYAFFILTVVLILAGSLSVRNIQNQRQQKMVVYHIPGGTGIDFFSGKNCYFLACEKTLADQRSLSFHVEENRLQKGIKGTRIYPLAMNEENFKTDNFYKTDAFIHFAGLNLKILEDDNILPKEDEDMVGDFKYDVIDMDYVIISGNPQIRIENINKLYPSAKVIIDHSNNFFQTSRWMEECESLGVECWSVRHHGAFELAIN
ncbi:MAG: ComEC/Rec2 family competence protein [Bacteroidales bacterium]